MNIMNNNLQNDAIHDTLKNLIHTGSNIHKEMVLEFFLVVPSVPLAKNVIFETTTIGFSSSYTIINNEVICYCQKLMVPNYTKIKEIEYTLEAIAKKYKGYADGFGTYGNA